MHSIWIQASILTFLSNLLLSHQTAQDTKLSIIWKWRALDKKIDYPSEEVKDLAIAQGLYIPGNVLLICADYHEATQRLFVAGPLFKGGFPASIFEVTRGQGLLRPFPKWPSYVDNRIACEDIFSVFRFQIDKCGLMWVLDSGRSGMLITSELICQPKILVYDLNNGDRLVAQHIIPQGVVTDRSRLTTIITESYASDCSDSIAYIADGNDHVLIVFDLAKGISWKVQNALFWPYPMPDQFLSGVIGLALDPPTVPDRKLYFHSFSSVKESWVPVRVVKNKSLSENVFASRGNFQVSPGDRKGISTVEVVTDDGIMIYALLSNEIACWNTKTPYTAENQHILWKDDENFIFLSGMKLKGNSLLLTSCRFQEYSAGIANGTDVTSRVMVIEDVKRLLYNTPCSPTYSESSFQTANNYISNGIQNSINPSTSIPNRASNFFRANYVRSGFENPSTSTSSWNRALNDASFSYPRTGFIGNGRRNYFYGSYNPVLSEESNQEYYTYY